MRTDVSALYIDPRGPYPKMLADCWDEARDARNYAGPNPVVAHPPCGPWGAMRHLSSQRQDSSCGPAAVASVQRWGGVLEHPAGSSLWSHCGLPRPGADADLFEPDGFTIEVEQVAWGHVARKRTWLYFVGVRLSPVLLGLRTGGMPTHWCWGTHKPGQKSTMPPGVKSASKEQRRRTPLAFAEWLIELASRARCDGSGPLRS